MNKKLYQDAIEAIREHGVPSVSYFQRRFKIDYLAAYVLVRDLEKGGIIGPSKGYGSRDILIDLDKPIK